MYHNTIKNKWIIIGTLRGGTYDCQRMEIPEGIQKAGHWNKVSEHLKWIKEIMLELNDPACEAEE